MINFFLGKVQKPFLPLHRISKFVIYRVIKFALDFKPEPLFEHISFALIFLNPCIFTPVLYTYGKLDQS